MSDDSAQIPDSKPPAADPQSVEGLFLAALGKASAEEREAFLNEACGDDVQRRRRIDALLRAYEDAGSFLEKPPVGAPGEATLSLDFLTPSADPGLLGMLGQYEVYEMLGRGGMGIVFRARDPKLNRVVAIKVLAPELAANPNARRRFLREAQAAAAISHPHVVTIHAVDEGSTASSTPAAESSRGASSLPFLVMECIVGLTLQQKLDKQGSLRLTEILRIGHQTACGLAAAHKQGLIHRDIKPANILLENGVERVKITDFGLARAADDVSITRTGEVSGTPQYMSPEQASGNTVDHRSDLFSLGCVLYAMCTGRSPFRATTLAAAIRRVCDDTPRPIEEINPEVPHWLIDIVNPLLAKDPDERIQTADEVEQLLGDRLAGVQQPGRMQRSPTPQPSPKPMSEPSPSPVASTLRMAVPLRLLLWLGSLLLLTPIFIAIGGTALDGGGDALEWAVIAAIVCFPAAVLIFTVALMDRSLAGHPFANAMFILLCVLLGPIGILLYLVRRDQYLSSRGGDAHIDAASSGARRPAETQPAGKPATQEIPGWLLTPMPGLRAVGKLIVLAGVGFLLFAFARLIQLDETWGLGLTIATGALGLVYYVYDRWGGSQPVFALWQWMLAIGVVFLGLMGGAPHGMLWYTDAPTHFVITMALLGQLLVVVGLVATAAGKGDAEQPRRSRDRLGAALIGSGLFVWITTALYATLLGPTRLPPLRPEYQDLAGPVMMGLVLSGGLLLGIGMWLQQRLVTPGMVRRVAMAADSHELEPAPSTRRSPWRVLGWLIVLGALFVPLSAIAYLGLWERLETPRNNVPHDGRMSRPQPSAHRPLEEDGFPPARVIPLASAGETDAYGDTTAYQPLGAVLLTFADEGLGVRFERVEDASPHAATPGAAMDSSMMGDFGGFGMGAAPGNEQFKSGTVKLAEGGYYVNVTDYLAGWGRKDSWEPPLGRALPSSTLPDPIEVVAGEFVRLTVHRDLKRIAELQPDWDQPGFFAFRWNGETYDLSKLQAVLVNWLQTSYADGHPEVSPAELQDVILEFSAEPAELTTIFNDGRHPAWGTLIVPGEHAGTYRLAKLQEKPTSSPPTPVAVVDLSFVDSGLGVQLEQQITLLDGSPTGAIPGQSPSLHRGDKSFAIQPGTYRVIVQDDLAGWRTKTKYGEPDAVRYEFDMLTLSSGETVELKINRNLYKLGAAFSTAGPRRTGQRLFLWNGETFELDQNQALVVMRLLKARADGSIDVHEGRLLSDANVTPAGVQDRPMSDDEAEAYRTEVAEKGHTLKGLFGDGKHPAWGTLVVEGEQPHTFRLSELNLTLDGDGHADQTDGAASDDATSVEDGAAGDAEN